MSASVWDRAMAMQAAGRADDAIAMVRVQPRVAVEADDRSLLHHFAQVGLGAVPVPDSIAREVGRQFGEVGVEAHTQEGFLALDLS